MGSSQSNLAQKSYPFEVIEVFPNGATHLRRTHDAEDCLLRTISSQFEEDLNRSISLLERRSQIPNPCALKLLQLMPIKQSSLCANTFILHALLQYSPKTLEKQIYQKRFKNLNFSQNQLLSAIYSCSQALKIMYEAGGSHECLTKKSIFITTEGVVKVADPILFGLQNNYYACLSANGSSDLPLAPQMLNCLEVNHINFFDKQSADVFVLALIIAEAALLEPIHLKVDRQSLKSIDGLLKRISEKYSRRLGDVLKDMLAISVEQRPSFSQVITKIERDNGLNEEVTVESSSNRTVIIKHINPELPETADRKPLHLMTLHPSSGIKIKGKNHYKSEKKQSKLGAIGLLDRDQSQGQISGRSKSISSVNQYQGKSFRIDEMNPSKALLRFQDSVLTNTKHISVVNKLIQSKLSNQFGVSTRKTHNRIAKSELQMGPLTNMQQILTPGWSSPNPFEAFPLEKRSLLSCKDFHSSHASNRSALQFRYAHDVIQGEGIYEGYFDKQGQRCGHGLLKFTHGGKYEGEWKNGGMHGFGKLYNIQGNVVYEGHWLKGQFSGQGRLYNSNPIQDSNEGDYNDLNAMSQKWRYYEGNFKVGLKDGKGYVKYTNGQMYQGTFYRDLIEGNGMYYRRGGKIVLGYWIGNKLFSKSSYDENP